MYNKAKKRENVPESRHAADLKSDVRRVVFSVPEDLDIPKQRSESSSCRGKELAVRGCTLTLYSTWLIYMLGKGVEDFVNRIEA